MTKDVKVLDQQLVAAGWQQLRCTKHYFYGCPCGKHSMTVPQTPSDQRSMKNATALFRRLRRACEGAV